MIRASEALERFHEAGLDLFSGVPCSYLTPLIDAVIDSTRLRYVGAANEGDAVAVAAGARLAGRGSVVLFQNSGLGNAVNPLTSLTHTFRIPVLVLTTWRGRPDGAPDEPQHEVMGAVTPAMLELMRIPWEPFPADAVELGHALERAARHMQDERRPYALIVSKGTVAPEPRRARAAPPRPAEPTERFEDGAWGGRPLDPDAALAAVQGAARPDDVLVATTGFTGRALYAQGDRPNQFYMVGSMGCASSFGLGLALARPERRIVVLDGDGAMLMRMGAVATIGHERPGNLVHVCLDNGVHDSTGAQDTVSPSVDLAGVAAACGYPSVGRVATGEGLARALREPRGAPTFVHVRTSPRASRELPRPTVTPPEVAERLRAWLAGR